jgi:hypothetical protein
MRIIYDKLTKEIGAVIVNDDSSITAFPMATHCAIQADTDTLVEMALAIGLNMTELIKTLEDNNIQFAMTPELEQILKDRAFGITFANTLLDRLKNQDTLTLTQRGQLLSKIHLFLTVLTIGDITAARAVLNNYATDLVLTAARKDWALAQLDAYIANA